MSRLKRCVSWLTLALLPLGTGCRRNDSATAGDAGSTPESGTRRDGGTQNDGTTGSDGGAGADARPDADSGGGPDLGTGGLPSGNAGIAARYPGDFGIEADDAVIFADDFESYGSAFQLGERWDDVYHEVRLATEARNVFAGTQALEFTVPQQTDEISNTVAVRLEDELNVLFLRYYSRFDPNFDVVGSSHNGGGISAHYYIDGQATPGVPADGFNKFLIAYECWRGEAEEASPGSLNVYIYHPDQRSQWGDHFFPDGTVLPNSSLGNDFGDEFVARTNLTPELGRWYSYEVMLQANTPGQRDGRIALWLDGQLIVDFPNLRLRETAGLTIDRFNLSLHAGSNPAGETHKWYDNVVAATSYIGPLYSP